MCFGWLWKMDFLYAELCYVRDRLHNLITLRKQFHHKKVKHGQFMFRRSPVSEYLIIFSRYMRHCPRWNWALQNGNTNVNEAFQAGSEVSTSSTWTHFKTARESECRLLVAIEANLFAVSGWTGPFTFRFAISQRFVEEGRIGRSRRIATKMISWGNMGTSAQPFYSTIKNH